uniref:Uncharacterized protein n=1 Tax=viral metagenome TaxID=1070528 RepID=A0A6C0BP68_9ZZZZ
MECKPHLIERYCQSTKRTYKSSAKIKALAKSCKVPYSGWIYPFHNLWKDKYTCIRLITKKPESVDYIPVSAQMHSYLEDILEFKARSDLKPLIQYTGFAEAGIYGLLYLLQRNRNACALFPRLTELVGLLLNSKAQSLDMIYIPWELAGLYWVSEEPGRSFEMRRFNEEAYVQQARSCSQRFMLTLLTLHSPGPALHANILLYDQDTHILERFDPYEVYTENIDQERLDLELQRIYARIDPQFQELISPPNLDAFDKFGLQLQQMAERKQVEGLDPRGFCQPWTFLYAQTRLSFPDQIPESIPHLFKQWVNIRAKSLTAFIRNYSKFLLQTSEVIYSEGIREDLLSEFADPRVGLMGLCLQRLEQQFTTT